VRGSIREGVRRPVDDNECEFDRDGKSEGVSKLSGRKDVGVWKYSLFILRIRWIVLETIVSSLRDTVIASALLDTFTVVKVVVISRSWCNYFDMRRY
jgi:hypothetical protein